MSYDTSPDWITTTFLDRYELMVATNDHLRDLAFSARYQVYCQELSGYEPKDRFPDGREHNPSDEHSLHVLVRDRCTGQAMGTARLVLVDPADPGAPLPFEEACGDTLEPDAVPLDEEARIHIAEMSRFAIVGQIRNRTAELSPAERAAQELMPYALAQLCLNLAEEIGITALYAVMEERLAYGMRQVDAGVQLMPIGPGIAFHGMRYPFQVSLGGMRSRYPILAEQAAQAVALARPCLPRPGRPLGCC